MITILLDKNAGLRKNVRYYVGSQGRLSGFRKVVYLRGGVNDKPGVKGKPELVILFLKSQSKE